jgi:F-type H+-transporting ATPase subunit b
MRVWLARVLLGAAVALIAAGLLVETAGLYAAQEHQAEKHDGGGHPAGVPSMSLEEKDVKQEVDLAVWSLITFVVFLFVLKKFAWGPLIEGLDRREAGVLENIAAAEAARVKAEKMLAEHAARLEKVQDEVREIIAEARRDAEHTKSEIMATAQKEAEATRARAVQDIERARDHALDDLFDHMGRCVREATETVIGRSLTGADNERLIEEALSGFAQQKH